MHMVSPSDVREGSDGAPNVRGGDSDGDPDERRRGL